MYKRQGDERPLLAKALGVGDAVIALVGGTQAGELVGVGHPVELSAVHDLSLIHICKIYMETKARPRYIISERTWAPYERKYHG